MNKEYLQVLDCIVKNKNFTQRDISSSIGFSLGKVNNQIKILKTNKYLDEKNEITDKTKKMIRSCKPKNAVILAAGYGFRMVPINQDTNKALIEVKGDILIERLIKQLHAVDIYDITIVVGYRKEQFEYLIDKYEVKLKINMEYASSNSLFSLGCVKGVINNTYIIPCDLYFEENPFSKYELLSWYMISDKREKSSTLECNTGKLKYVKNNGNRLIGVSYINDEDKDEFVNRLEKYSTKENRNSYWEEILIVDDKSLIGYKIIKDYKVEEFNTFEDLQKFDSMSPTLKTEIMEIVKNVLEVSQSSIKNIIALKTGMTNRSFLFECKGRKYIMRIPGEGTDMLIDRKQEKKVYETIKKHNISDCVLYFDDIKGYKMTEFIEGVHNCNPQKKDEVKKCMIFLKKFHNMKLKVTHEFNVFEKIEYYQKLWEGKKSIYKDYEMTKSNVYELKQIIDNQDKDLVLTHVDAVPDNFLFFEENGEEKIKLIDWEYASMQDPHLDIAMFAIYSLYERKQIDELIDFYFEGNCEIYIRIKIYCYIACCGLLWSNWCEYKHALGVEFGEYSIAQYRYAKEYYKIVKKELEMVEKNA